MHFSYTLSWDTWGFYIIWVWLNSDFTEMVGLSFTVRGLWHSMTYYSVWIWLLRILQMNNRCWFRSYLQPREVIVDKGSKFELQLSKLCELQIIQYTQNQMLQKCRSKQHNQICIQSTVFVQFTGIVEGSDLLTQA